MTDGEVRDIPVNCMASWQLLLTLPKAFPIFSVA